MKKQIFLIILLLACRICIAQNLVPNGDFEQYSGCPTGLGQLDSALFWMNPSSYPPGGSPDYLNQCNLGWLNVPNSIFGYQQAHSGVAYCGIGLWDLNNSNFREYIESPLTSALIANTCYHFEMFISSSSIGKYASDDIQVYFSNTAITGINNYNPLPFTPQLSNATGNFSDTLNWTLVSGDYMASGGEQYLIIGNFKNDVATNLILINNGGQYSFASIFIDDVSLVTPCNTAIQQIDKTNTVNIFPNPFSNSLNVYVTDNQSAEIILYDITGRKILQQEFANTVSLNTEKLAQGIYIYEVRNKNGLSEKGKVVKD